MTSRREGSERGAVPTGVPAQQFWDLVDDKAWRHLGMTGEEFVRRWHDGGFSRDERPEVVALDDLMRTGRWGPF